MNQQQYDILVDALDPIERKRVPKRGDVVFIPNRKEYWVIIKHDKIKIFSLDKWLEAGNRGRKERGEEQLKI